MIVYYVSPSFLIQSLYNYSLWLFYFSFILKPFFLVLNLQELGICTDSFFYTYLKPWVLQNFIAVLCHKWWRESFRVQKTSGVLSPHSYIYAYIYIYVHISTEISKRWACDQKEPEHPALGWSCQTTCALRKALPIWGWDLQCFSVFLGPVCLCVLLAQTPGSLSSELFCGICIWQRWGRPRNQWQFVFAAVPLTHSVTSGKSRHAQQLIFQYDTEVEIPGF